MSLEGRPAQAVVVSIVWTFRTLKKPGSREVSALSYSLLAYAPTSIFFFMGCPVQVEILTTEVSGDGISFLFFQNRFQGGCQVKITKIYKDYPANF